MVVEESPEALQAVVHGTKYYFCSESCLLEFTKPELEIRSIRSALILSVVLGIPILFLSYVSLPLPFSQSWLLLLLATPVQFIAGWRFYRGTYDAIRMRSSNMDVLIAIGTTAAFFYSLIYVLFPRQFPFGGLYFDTSAVIIALILTGRLLEHAVRNKATEAIRKLSELQPTTATILVGGVEKQIPIEQLSVGDIFVVKPGERIATDGTVEDGHSSVDEKLVTGESIPVEKIVGSTVIGGTINAQGSLRVRATKVGTDTTLSKIAQIVQQAQNFKAPVERLVDTISKYFVPLVAGIAILSFASWILVGHQSISFGFTAAVAVLVIACPCALGLATPAAITVGAGKGAENGILIKGGEYLERMQHIDTVVFDKTGTLTKGEPSVTDLINFRPAEISDDELLLDAAICEKLSEHPLASAVLKKARDKFPAGIPDPESFDALPGKGVHAVFQKHDLFFGNEKILDPGQRDDGKVLAVVRKLQNQGKTVMLLSVDGKIVGALAAADQVKVEARGIVGALQKMHLEVMMLTGDSKETAAAVARDLGIEKYVAEVLPGEKYEVIRKLQEYEHRKVAMVGDGVNDAPALAQADVGIALGSGSDVAIETGGLVLMRDDLRDVVAGIQLSRKTMAKIKQNLFWAFIYNIALIPVAAGALYIVTGVLLNPIFAGLAMALSSVTVVTNSLTLRSFKPKF